ncbi:hypothetical protein ABMY88_23100, partial [Escherichia coli]
MNTSPLSRRSSNRLKPGRSLAARTDTWLQSLLVWSPGQRDIIK